MCRKVDDVKLTELIEAVGSERVDGRLIRYLYTEGVIARPDLSRGRTNASYDEDHVRQIQDYLRLSDLGFSLTQMRSLFKSGRGETVPFELAPGITLQVDLSVNDGSMSADEIAERARQILASLFQSLAHKGNDDVEAA